MVLSECECIAGYTRYIELIPDLLDGKEVISTGMMQEIDRCKAAVLRAEAGKKVAVICSGDPGVYGMAGLIIEIAHSRKSDITIEIIPGVTAANASAARLGAPLMLDYAVISLSDLLVPWDSIKKRLRAVAAADLVTVLYNPKSKTRIDQFTDAIQIFLEHREGTVPAGIATAMGTPDESVVISTIDKLTQLDIGMRSVVIIGNSTSIMCGEWFITPRGYQV